MSDIQVVQVLWGPGTYLPQVQRTTAPSIASFYASVLGGPSPLNTWLDADYNTVGGTNQHFGTGTFAGQYLISPSTGTMVDDSQIQSELRAQIAAGNLPSPAVDAAGRDRTYYAIFFPAGTAVTLRGMSSCTYFGGYHNAVPGTAGTPTFAYGVHPDMTACPYYGPSAWESTTIIAWHELAETMTNPGTLATGYGWVNSNGGGSEIADICTGTVGTTTGTDGLSYTVQYLWSNSRNACYLPDDFAISTPLTAPLQAGSRPSSVSISTRVTSGGPATITLSVSGVPRGLAASIAASATSGDTVQLSLRADGSVSAGTYPLTISGTSSDGISHAAVVTVVVTAAAQHGRAPGR
ncbi:hypothetical protein SPF06_08070 [Sinomonas sp. JGH33]|uniref:Uncharacterized protein n=1 Tax=Sinomonas terricola TaxID=3110330 RepID=A0ABU5T4Z9_9MICC|nr:hypothetical protein [Sinomonas sp. JGH33]MEA5454673.1 hypothetical protein [Sinomonas sp. JGH33]